MALHYNLAKVYALSDNDPEFVLQIVTLFVTEIPEDIAEIKEGIKKKDHKHDPYIFLQPDSQAKYLLMVLQRKMR